MKAELTALYRSEKYAPIHEQRRSLPIFQVKQDIVDAVSAHPVVVVSGETGSGKTTQLPLYLLENMIKNERADECYIICTQPRRIAAISIAERVHYECAQHLRTISNTSATVNNNSNIVANMNANNNAANKDSNTNSSSNSKYTSNSVGTGLVGYQVRLDSRSSARTKLIYCTTGVLLRRLQEPDFLKKVSHVILDEVHERGVETDFLMTLLKQQAPVHPALRLVS